MSVICQIKKMKIFIIISILKILYKLSIDFPNIK